MSDRIFIVEDDRHLSEKVKEVLVKWNYTVGTALKYEKVMEELTVFNPDLILMDIALPKYDGYYLCREIRKDSDVPIVFISSRDQDMDIILAMEMGGDDFVVKPFSVEVLLAKIKAILRRKRHQADKETGPLAYGGLELREDRQSVSFEGKAVELTRNEWRILHELVSHGEQIVSRNRLMDVLWDSDQFINDNTLTVNVNRLRQKLEDIGFRQGLQTKKGQGYQLLAGSGE